MSFSFSGNSPKRIGVNQRKPGTKEKGKSGKTPLLETLFEASTAFENLQRRNKEASSRKPKVKSLSERRSLAIQETIIRKQKQVSRRRNPQDKTFYCKPCNSTVIGLIQWNSHLEGKKHRKKVINIDIQRCEVCNLDFNCPEDRKNHLSSARHRKQKTFGSHSIYKKVVKHQ